jgi:hypothetical protein
MIAQVEVLIGEDLPLAGQVSMMVGVSVITLLVMAGDLIPTVLELRPLISRPGRVLCFEVDCQLLFNTLTLLFQTFEHMFTLLAVISRG